MAELKPVRRTSLADAVFEQLRGHIVSGGVRAGDPLPAERVLAQMLGVNRQAVREGLKRLAQAGLVDVRQGGGTRVLDFRETGGLELLGSMLVSPTGVHTGVARSVLELRAALAPEIARACAVRSGSTAGPELRQRVAELRAASDPLVAQEVSLAFWGDLVRGTGNVAYRLAFNSLDGTYRQIMHHLTRLLEPELRAFDRYEAVAEAVASGDGERAAREAAGLVALGTVAFENVLGALEALEEEP